LVEALNIAMKTQGVDAGVQLMQNRLIMVNKLLLAFKEDAEAQQAANESATEAPKPKAKTRASRRKA
jgi:hypothetical protein